MQEHEYPVASVRNVPFRYAPGDGHVYRWHGGEHITIYRVEVTRDPVTGEESRQEIMTGETINVWDYATGAPRIRRTGQAMAVAVDDWRYNRRRADQEVAG